MQHAKEELKAQQLILKFLGFYKGNVDGIWSDMTIKAKQAFECDDRFSPASPNFGLPFSKGVRLPKGMFWEHNLVSHRDLTADKARELLNPKPKENPAKEVQAKESVEVIVGDNPAKQKG